MIARAGTSARNRIGCEAQGPVQFAGRLIAFAISDALCWSIQLCVFSSFLSPVYLLISKFIKQIFLAVDSQVSTNLRENVFKIIQAMHAGHLPCTLDHGQDGNGLGHRVAVETRILPVPGPVPSPGSTSFTESFMKAVVGLLDVFVQFVVINRQRTYHADRAAAVALVHGKSKQALQAAAVPGRHKP